jgi:hypothetical protein
MKCEGGSLKGERNSGCGCSNFALRSSPFFSAATIKKNFEELGV